ncbi:hypothetical protein NliqN6_0070 [Naganishia liquefaciens]|uniref:Coiled-coil domain-containing protein 16 n=1 Tax=Naganishia liquefaciens TaxID=104408 RepID=A0A8H3TMD6_9TREE|nr:hypothetical protein NliqN6_0070 [Naganishia liquefaciens]
MDARSLLRAKKAGATASASATGNPYLKIDAKGDQRCSICGVLAKHWDAHQVSKQHKTSLQRIRQEEAAAAAAAARKKEGKKRQAVDEAPMTGPTVEDVPAGAEADRGKRVRTDDAPGPVDTSPANSLVDAELDDFLSSLSAIPDIPAETEPPVPANKSRYKPSQPETQTHYESAAVLNAPPPTKSTAISSGATAASNPFAGKLTKKVDIGPALPAEDVTEEAEEEETEAERRAREQREEREEIMDRLEEEQRAQEEADERVQSLKARLELVKKRRALAKQNKVGL